jgi:phosphate transport system substrate-binding protein
MNLRTVLFLIIVALLLLSSIAGCSQTSAEQGDKGTIAPVVLPILTGASYPSIDGSTSTSPLGAILACHAMKVSCQWVDFIDGNRYLMPDLTGYQGEFPNIGHTGTHSAYLNLINRKADLILVARLPSEEELDLARLSGTDLITEPIALDAFVFIVNENNPVDELSLQEIQRIYIGELTDWSEVGGPQTEIHPYQRDEQSGSQQLMLSLVMNGLPMIDTPLMVLPKMISPFYAVSDDPLGIGYSVYYYEENMAPNELVKLVSVDGVKPDSETIQARQYPFTTEVFAVVRADSKPTSVAIQFRDWLLTTSGQELIEESGYVPFPR